jgi:hypothetical protein
MSEVATKVVVNCADGTSEIIPLTEAELEQRELDRFAWEAAEAERKAAAAALATLKASAKAKLIAGEPLTEAEADTLVI